jgi:hypothetical protein
MRKIKKIGLLLLAITLFISCTNQNSKLAKNKELIENYVKAVEANDSEIMETLLADNYIGYGPSIADSIDKKGAVENWKFNLEYIYESIHYDKSRTIAVEVLDGENKGEWVSNWAELSIVYQIGDEVKLMTNSIYKIEDGKIVKSYTFYNEADVYRQLGFGFIK